MANPKGPPGRADSGDWNLDSAAPLPLTIKQRVDTQLGVTSQAVIDAMRAEDAFIASIKPDAFPVKRFTDRRPIPGRKREKP